MGLIRLYPEEARFFSSSFPQLALDVGGSVPWFSLLYDDSTDETAYWLFPIEGLEEGDFSVRLFWYASSATSGSVVWQAQVGALTPEEDTQDITTKTLGAQSFVQDGHLGTTAKRMHKAILSVADLNGASDGDLLLLAVGRDADSTYATDDLVGDVGLALVEVSIS